MQYQEILKQLEDYQAALAGEAMAARLGQKLWPDYSPIQMRHADLFSRDGITALQEEISRTMNPRERDRMERVLFALLEGMIAEKSIPLADDMARESSRLSAVVDNDKIAFDDFRGLIANEEDPGKRERLRAAYTKLIETLGVKYLDREHAVRQSLSVFGFNSCREYVETKKKIRLESLLEKSLPILQETTGLYRRVMSDALRKAYGQELGEVSAAHASHWLSGHEFAHLFPAEKLVPQCLFALDLLGLDINHAPAIAIDAESLMRKKPRARHFAIHVPDEICLTLKPRAGFEEVRTFMHEMGRALHLARTDASLPFEHRALPRSSALGETYALTLEHLTENPLWLEHAMKLPKAAAERVAGWSLLGNLFRLRRQIAKFTYELSFDERPYDTASNKQLYAKTIHDLTGFRYEPSRFYHDREDLFFASADGLRAWIASAQLEEHLVRKYSDRWFLKRESGAFLKELFAKGVSWGCEEMTASLGMTAWDPLPLIRKFDAVSKLLR